MNLHGDILLIMHSKFPGGFCNPPAGGRGGGRVSVLDGVFDARNRALYLLDVIEYGPDQLASRPLLQRAEYLERAVPDDLAAQSVTMEIDVVDIPALPCDRSLLASLCAGRDSSPLAWRLPGPDGSCIIAQIDGVLLYRKRDPYTSGRCGAVVWVPAGRASELLRVDRFQEIDQ